MMETLSALRLARFSLVSSAVTSVHHFSLPLFRHACHLAGSLVVHPHRWPRAPPQSKGGTHSSVLAMATIDQAFLLIQLFMYMLLASICFCVCAASRVAAVQLSGGEEPCQAAAAGTAVRACIEVVGVVIGI